jgi:hypothetical protein
MRNGVFEGYGVYGNLFEECSGKRYWILKLVLDSSERSDYSERYYWISGNEFRNIFQGRLLEGLTPKSNYLLGDVDMNVPLAERQAALKAISTWETRAANSQSG